MLYGSWPWLVICDLPRCHLDFAFRCSATRAGLRALSLLSRACVTNDRQRDSARQESVRKRGVQRKTRLDDEERARIESMEERRAERGKRGLEGKGGAQASNG